MGLWGAIGDATNWVGDKIRDGAGDLAEIAGLTDSDEQKKQKAAEAERIRLMNEQAGQAGGFAGVGEAGYGQLGAEAADQRGYLRDLASGKNSISAEQLRQGLQQNLSSQRSMAASAAPGNASMAARNAAMNMGRASSGMAGQQAVAGLQERQNAQQALANMILQQRGQDLSAALGSRQNAISGYGGTKQDPAGPSGLQRLGGMLSTGFAMSDRTIKTDIEDGGKDAAKILSGLKSYTFKYKDAKHGAGKQFGVMAQDLEKAGLKHAVIDTPRGKAVHGAKLATSLAGMMPELHERISKLEKARGGR